MNVNLSNLDPNDPALADLGNWLFSSGGDEQAKASTARNLLGELFLPSPPMSVCGEDHFAAVDPLVRSFVGSDEPLDLNYELPYPKWEFLQHLTSQHGFLLHGSGASLSELEPRPQDDWTGRPVEAVFATSDPIWAMFFAAIDRKSSGNIRNGGLRIRSPDAGDERYYFFSVAGAEGDAEVLRPGYVHLIRRQGFETSPATVSFDEWLRNEPTRVVARLAISPKDYPFRHIIARHPEEPMVATWLNYRKRIRTS